MCASLLGLDRLSWGLGSQSTMSSTDGTPPPVAGGGSGGGGGDTDSEFEAPGSDEDWDSEDAVEYADLRE